MQKRGSAMRLALVGASALVALAAVVGISVLLSNAVTAASVVPSATPTNADQRAVVATVQAFTDAWLDEDCAAYLAITTQREQEEAGIADCASFGDRSAAFTAIVSDAEIVFTDVRGPEYQYTVTTRERFAVQRDTDGIRLAEPQHVTVEYSYDVVPHDDHWAILWWSKSGTCDYWSSALTTARGATCMSSESSY